MPSPRIGLFLYASFVALLSLAILWLLVFAVGPKLEYQIATFGSDPWFPPFFTTMFAVWRICETIFWPVACIFIGVILAGAVPFKFRGVRLISRWIVVVTSIVVFCFLLVSLFAALRTTLEIHAAELSRLKQRNLALENFALFETAEGRPQQLLSELPKSSGLALVEIDCEKDLAPTERKLRASHLSALLKLNPSESATKRLLASSQLFQKEITSYNSSAQIVLKSANSIESNRFKTIDDFFNWLPSQVGKDGWIPAPLYRVEQSGRK